MGTSKRWKGPTGDGWSAARRRLSLLTRELSETLPDETLSNPDASAGVNDIGDELRDRIDQNVEQIGRQLLRGLRELIAEDPEVLGLREVTLHAARRLVDTLDALLTEGVGAVCWLDTATAEQSCDEFISAFADRVAGPGGLIADAVIRRTAVHSAEHLLKEDSHILSAVKDRNVDSKISGDLFCIIYAFFFADAVSEFLVAVVAEKMKIAFPLLSFDPTDQVAKWIAEKIVGLIPNPCEEQEKLVDDARSLGEIAHELAAGSVDRALGLDRLPKAA